jgi:hypothetical protein
LKLIDVSEGLTVSIIIALMKVAVGLRIPEKSTHFYDTNNNNNPWRYSSDGPWAG